MTSSRVVNGLLAGFLIGCLAPTALAQIKTKETKDLRLIYPAGGQAFMTSHVAACFENAMQFHRELWDYTPAEPVTVFLADFADRGNASASTVPRNFLMLQSSPLGLDFETVSPNERFNWLMNHELTHISAQDNAAHSDRFFRALFRGKVVPVAENPESILYFYLTTPRVAAPGWYQEGIATFVETWMAGGLGRAKGYYDEMVFRSMVRDDSHFYDPLGLASEGIKIDFQMEVNSYLYGTRFMSYLAYEYSPESLVDWIARNKGSRKYYASQFKNVYGRTLTEIWKEWIAWEHEFQQANLDAIQQYPLTQYEDISSSSLGSISRAQYDPDTGKLYAGLFYPGTVAHIGAISVEDGSLENITDIKGPVIYAVTSTAYDRESKTLFYTTDNMEYRDVRALDPETGKETILLKDKRIGDLAFNAADRSLWGVRHEHGMTTLVRIPHPYEEWFQIHTWPFGDVMYGLDISDDGHYLSASVGEPDGRQSLRVWEIESLLEKETTPIAEWDPGHTIPLDFVFSPDGKYLYGSTYYTGVSNIFRYDFRADKWDALSNTDTGFFRPIPLEDGRVILFRFTGDGFVPSVIDPKPLEDISPIKLLGEQVDDKYTLSKEWNVGAPVPVEDKITREGDYRGFKQIGLESWYPIVEGYKDYGAFGGRVNLSDPLGLNRLFLTASYTPNDNLPSDERLHARLNYKRYDLRAKGSLWAEASINRADFYDLFGPTKTSRKGQAYSFGYDKTLIYDQPRKMDLNLAAYFAKDIDTLPLYQNVLSPVDQVASVMAKLDYSHKRRSIGSVDAEKGYQWQVLNDYTFVEGETIPTLLGTIDKGFALPLKYSSIWLRGAGGFAIGDIENAYSNLYFGGFGNNYVDHREVKRYREFYSFPGVEINEIQGRNFAKLMLDWSLPHLRFRRVGRSGLFMSWMRPAVFASAIVTDLDQDSRALCRSETLMKGCQEVGNVGAQIDFAFTLVSRLPMKVSVGYAVAFGQDRDTSDEFMASLAIMP